jgi:hypothetical protein
VIGEHIVDILEGRPGARFAKKWGWPEKVVEAVAKVVTKDGSRVDAVQVVLETDNKAGLGPKMLKIKALL